MAGEINAFVKTYNAAYVVANYLRTIHDIQFSTHLFTDLKKIFEDVTKAQKNLWETLGVWNFCR